MRITIRLKNLTNQRIIISDLSDCSIEANQYIDVSVSNKISQIIDSNQLFDLISQDNVVLSVDGVDLSKNQSLRWMDLPTTSILNTGWWYIKDETYTEANPLTISETRTLIDMSIDSDISGFAPLGKQVSDIYDESTGSITPLNIGDSYSFRLTFQCKSSTIDNRLLLDLDIQSEIIFKDEEELPEAGISKEAVFNSPIFALNNFKANGGRFYATSTIGSVDIFDINLFLVKLT